MNKYMVENFVGIISNTSSFEVGEIVSVCKRVNNTKRDYLFVNSIQGKHVPVHPSKAIHLFKELASSVIDGMSPNEKVCVIGFAETATAIGRYIAIELPNCVIRTQTTRENLNLNKLIDFEEEHSHDVNQSLFGSIEQLSKVDRILFVEDEITTGNTILNFISEFNKVLPNMKYAVASILNWQSKENEDKFKELGVDTYCLIRGYIKEDIEPIEVEDVSCLLEVGKTDEKVSIHNFSIGNIGYEIDRNTSNSIPPMKISTDALRIKNILGKNKKVLVLGTEEFMFGGLHIANMISECSDIDVKFHATTRSPIQVSLDTGYVVRNGYSIHSIYDVNRNTLVYNIEKYDHILIVTDIEPNSEFISDMKYIANSIKSSLDIIVIK